MSNLRNDGNELDLDIDESQEDESFVTYDIATYPSDFTLSGIYEMYQREDITIPDFQREFVWTIRQASLLIELFLLGLPIPPVFFYINDQNKNLVIDGQQRILSVVFYFDGFFGVESILGRRQVFRLTGLSEASPYHKKQFKELSESDQRKLRGAVLRAINIRQLSPDDDNTSIYHIFERLNTGGTSLRPQEIRSVVFRGEFNNTLRELNKDENWRKLIGSKNFDKHQTDIELILRLFSLSQKASEYEKPMKEFMNSALKKNVKGNTSRVRRFEKLFPKAAKLLAESLGDKPFHLRGKLNTSALDSVFCTTLDNLEQIPSDLDKRYNRLRENPTFSEVTTLGTTDTSIVKKRFDLVRSLLLGN